MPGMGDLVELPDSARKAVTGATRLGDADPNERVLVSIIVKRKAGKGFSLAEPPAQGADRAAWRREQRARFAETDGADQADLDAVASWAREAGLQVRASDRARRTVTLEGTVAQFNRALGVSLGRYEAGHRTYRGREGAVQIPRHLAGTIDAVLGLDDRQQAQPHLRAGLPLDETSLPHPDADVVKLLRDRAISPADSAPTPQPLWAKQVAQAYNFPTDVNGSGETIGIIELGGGFGLNDIDGYFTKAGIAKPNVVAVPVDNGSNAPGVNPDNDGEVLLDIEVAGSIAPGAVIATYFADPSDRGFIDAITQAVHDPDNAPSVISISWGGPEDQWTSQARRAFEAALSDAAKLGVTVFCAAGDHGAGDAAGDGHAHVDYPASSPHIVACGGTTLTVGPGQQIAETAWNDRDGWATGGGISEISPLPAWQNITMPANLNGSGPGRGVPDVAGNADATTGYIILVDGQWSPIGGTSAVAPLYAGLLACINQANGQPVGELSPRLYDGKAAGVFHDVQTGNNSVPASPYGPAVNGYSAGPGWNACTGMGSIDGTALRSQL